MAKKLGDVLIIMTVLLFSVGGISYVLNEVETSEELTNSYLTSSFTELNDNLSGSKGVNNLNQKFANKIDNSSVLKADSELNTDNTGRDAGSLTNIFTKNILTNFFKTVTSKFNVPPIIVYLIVALSTIMVTILVVRLFIGEGKV